MITLQETIRWSWRREWVMVIQTRHTLFMHMLFLFMLSWLVPYALPPQAPYLSEVASGMVWISLLLGSLISADRFFEADVQSGFMDQLLAHHTSLPIFFTIKWCVTWLSYTVPLIITLPLWHVMWSLPFPELAFHMLSIFLGSAYLFLVSMLIASLQAQQPNSPSMLALLLFPTALPILMLGSSSWQWYAHGQAQAASMVMLIFSGITLLGIACIPYACSWIIREMWS